MCCKSNVANKPTHEANIITIGSKDQQRSGSTINRDSDHEPSTESWKSKKNQKLQDLMKYQQEIQKNCADNCPTKIVLTTALVEKYLDLKTANKIQLKDIVLLKVTYPNAPCPYVLDAENYDVFGLFFKPLIGILQMGNDYSNFCQGLSFGETEQFADLDLNDGKDPLRVIYADMTIRRNLNDFNLAGVITSDQRLTVRDMLKAKVKEVFSSLSIMTVPNEWTEKLKMDENYLKESRAMRDYPNGRLNVAYRDENDASVGAIINFDDHLQLMISINDGKIGHIYHQICQILNSSVFCKMDFMKHEKYGYLTNNPQFLGTGFSIRLFLKLPYVSNLDDAEEIYLRDIGLTLRPNPGSRQGLLILSNKRTLNITELAIFNGILEGFRRLHELDIELENTSPLSITDETMPTENLTKLASKIYNCESAKTYAKKYLNDTIIHQYSGISTSFNGLFNHCIRANAFYPKSLFPKASDPDCYSTFGRYFSPIILEANNARQFLHNNSPIYEVANKEIRYKFKHHLIKGYRVRFSRNLEEYPFPMLMSSKDREDIESRLVEAFKNFPKEIAGRYIKYENLKTDSSMNLLNFLNLIPKPNNLIKKASWVYRNWPKNRGIFVANKSQEHPYNVLIIIVNEDDHFQVSCINFIGQRLDYCYDRAVIVMKFMDVHFNHGYAKKPNYGFLSSNPQNVGCCMRIGAKILLANLGQNMNSFNDFCLANHMNYRGAQGSGSLAKDNIFDVSLKLNLNNSEIQVLMFFLQRLKDLIIEERTYDYTIPKPINEPGKDDSIVPMFSKPSAEEHKSKQSSRSSRKFSSRSSKEFSDESSGTMESTGSKNDTMEELKSTKMD